MNFIYAYIDVLKAFSDFRSRTSRTEFWGFTLFNLIVLLVLGAFSADGLASMFFLITFIPSLAVSVRRLHDIGKSGLHLLWFIIPFFGAIYLLVLFLQKGGYYANKWGNAPAEINVWEG